MNYEEMSDFEINKLVVDKHLHLFVNEAKSRRRLDSDVWVFDSEGLLRNTNYNPCNNPSDAWPIIFDSGMSIWQVTESDREIGMSYATGDWGAYCVMQVDGEGNINSDGFEALDSNPLRAAMICFLKMKDAENGNN